MNHPSRSHAPSDSSVTSLPSSTQLSTVWPDPLTTPSARARQQTAANPHCTSRQDLQCLTPEIIQQTHRIGANTAATSGSLRYTPYLQPLGEPPAHPAGRVRASDGRAAGRAAAV
ncbi:hypothetical protein CDV55_106356 [Aspergillus turcosus]|uniref:Uncharacterized protein n=1 Tax=Aspergillus turcosus TaxID=1245748 RepID=A0A229XPL7_9EURO|nr:hypothetical protein CDV55_106356 [Aspergillus turcosus]RLM00099.1 hypothetical protein CFD26_107645 [Aspergillus turcosus]